MDSIIGPNIGILVSEMVDGEIAETSAHVRIDDISVIGTARFRTVLRPIERRFLGFPVSLRNGAQVICTREFVKNLNRQVQEDQTRLLREKLIEYWAFCVRDNVLRQQNPGTLP